MRFLITVLLALSTAHVLAAPTPPSPKLPGEFRAVRPADAKNIGDKQVYIANPKSRKNDNVRLHPGLVLEPPSPGSGRQRIAIVTKNLRGAAGAPIKDLVPGTPLEGFISKKEPMKFDQKDINDRWKDTKTGELIPNVSPKTLERFKKSIGLGGSAAAFQQAGARAAAQRSRSPQASGSNAQTAQNGKHSGRLIIGLPQRKNSAPNPPTTWINPLAPKPAPKPAAAPPSNPATPPSPPRRDAGSKRPGSPLLTDRKGKRRAATT